MTERIKRFTIRTNEISIKYDTTQISSAHSVYVLAYASPMAGYLATVNSRAERAITESSNIPTYHKIPVISDLSKVMQILRAELASTDDNNNISDLVNSDFIIEKSGDEYERRTETRDDEYLYQATVTTYQKYRTRLMIEVLLLQKAEEIKVLLESASAEKRRQFYSAIHKIKLYDQESIHFDGFNLTDVSFAGASLGQSTFNDANTTNADFSGSNLKTTNLTQAQLDAAASYSNAQLRDGMWVDWDRSVKDGMLTRIQAMEDYINQEIPAAEHAKRQKVQALCNEYKPLLTGNEQINSVKKAEIVNAFTCKETTEVLSQYRNLKSRAAELCTFLAGLITGVGLIAYGAALCIQRYRNGYWGLFVKPKTAALAHQVIRHTPTIVGA